MFLSNGARAVLATLWEVNDASTAAFMAEFYARYLADPDKPFAAARALQETQMAFLKRPPVEDINGVLGPDLWTHPHHWAPFTVAMAI